MPKSKKKRGGSGQSQHSQALPAQLHGDKFARPKDVARIKFRDRALQDQEYVDDRLSRRILEQAKQQQQELVEEYGGGGSAAEEGQRARQYLATTMHKLQGDQSSDSEEEEPVEEEPTDEYDFNEVRVDEEDERALSLFMNQNPAPRRTLADIIMEKIAEKEAEIQTQFSDIGSVQVQDLDPRVKQLYRGVREVLSKYRSGKIPKAFKIVPHLSNWEQILYLTDPPCWTAAAVLQATRIFTANLKEKMAQRYFNLVLLPRVRDDISEYKRLNFHLYQALRKALFKPGAFMKGILIPLCESGTCSLREAIVIGSIIARNSIPVLHSAAAMLKIAEMDYSGANSIFLRIFFDKKYAMPYRVVDAVVNHFVRFQTDRRQLPVLWHQALLTFMQRYKGDISTEQKEAILELVKVHSHPGVSQEVRRELANFKCRDETGETNEETMDMQSNAIVIM